MTRLAVIAVATVLASTGTSLAQRPADAGTGTYPYIQFGLVRPGSAQPTATVGSELEPGEPWTALFTAGDSLCGTSFGGFREADLARHGDAPTAVRLAAELLGQDETGAYSIRFTSERLRSAVRFGAAGRLEQTLSLRDGDRIVLDMLRDPNPPAGCDKTAIALEARLFVRQPSGLAQTLFVADVWLVHTDDSGREWNQHMVANVNGTADVPLLFGDIAFPLPKLDPGQDDFSVFVRVSGGLRARARADGAIDLELSTSRDTGVMSPVSDNSGMSGRSKWKRLTVAVGETTAIDIPQPASGRISVPLRRGDKLSGRMMATRPGEGPAGSGQKMWVADGRFVLNTGEFFKGHTTRLLVRLRRAD